MPGGRVFGGQVLAQASIAATRTVAEDRKVHSMHGYFLRPGDVEQPITFSVDRIHDGRSFATRRTQCYQNGEPILSMIASFQDTDAGLEHSVEMPNDLPDPESLPSTAEALGGIDHPVAKFWATRARLRHPSYRAPGLLPGRGRALDATSGVDEGDRPVARRPEPAPRGARLRERLRHPRADHARARRLVGHQRAQGREPRPRDVVAPRRPGRRAGCSTSRSRPSRSAAAGCRSVASSRATEPSWPRWPGGHGPRSDPLAGRAA